MYQQPSPDSLFALNGGASRFPDQPGVYALTFIDDDGERLYVGASQSIQRRVKEHMLGANVPSWACRLAAELVEGTYLDVPAGGAYQHPRYEAMVSFVRASTDAEVLELLPPGATEAAIRAAENRWMAELDPSLTAPGRSKGGYCFKPRRRI